MILKIKHFLFGHEWQEDVKDYTTESEKNIYDFYKIYFCECGAVKCERYTNV